MRSLCKKLSIGLLGWLLAAPVCAQAPYKLPTERPVKVTVTPDHADWTYQPGEPVRFTVSVLQNGHPLKGAQVRYEIGPEKRDATKQATVTLPTGTLTVDGGTLKEPGFLRCVATYEQDGVRYRNLATAGFAPARLQPTATEPADFDTYWAAGKEALALLPLDLRLTPLPERNTARVNVYHLNVQNVGKSRVYGILCVPSAPGKYPAVLRVPGAGARPYAGDVALAEKGFITLEIGIHGVPVTLDPAVYVALSSGMLANYAQAELDNRDLYYYHRVYLGCLRANDALVSLPEFDGRNLLVAGGSQGGALSIVTAALDPRVRGLAANYPALCDLTGDLHGRAGGWPNPFGGTNLANNNTPAKIRTAGYYDVVNFARRLRVPGRYSFGFNDEVCAPTSVYTAYNVITAPKTLDLFPDTGHWTYPEQDAHMTAWLLAQAQKP